MIRKTVLATLASAVLGVGLLVAPAQAKCPKDCKQTINTNFKTCKSACASLTGADKRTCKKTCKTARHDARTTCSAATSPTPPNCSASPAFVD